MLAVLVCVGCLLPFVDKPFYIDDPLFLWSAQHIQNHPTDPYGFDVHWYVAPMRMADVTKNPPLACYVLALAAWLFGWGETALHGVLLLPAAGVAWGTYRLAQGLTDRPLIATLAAVLTPVFLVSSTNVMCDMLMLCFWVWAIVCWRRGLERPGWRLVAGVLIGLCALTKYFGISLIPLLLAYTLWTSYAHSQARLARSASDGAARSVLYTVLALLIPVAMLIAYDLWMWQLYKRDLLLDAIGFSMGSRGSYGTDRYPLRIGLIFTGGCLASVLCYLPLLWPRERKWALTAGALAIVVPLALVWTWPVFAERKEDQLGFLLHAALFLLGGIAVVILAVAEVWQHRDADGGLLLFWTAGTLVFANQLNWVINARTLLPLAPAVGILIARRLDWRRGSFVERAAWREVWPLIPAAVLALFVAEGDYRQAVADRQAAESIGSVYGHQPGRLWFEGHWGFQYYLRQHGGREVNLETVPPILKGDHVAFPGNNYGVNAPGDVPATVAADITQPLSPLASTMHPLRGAGFYSHVHGPLPFVLGPSYPVLYRVLRFDADVNVAELGWD
jgi:hypothetical protein